MNKGILGFKVFRRRKPACKAVAIISAFAMLSVGAFPALAGGVSGHVLDNVNGGASVIKSTDNVAMSGGGSSATLSLLGGKSGLIDWAALNIGNGQSLSFQGGNFYNVVQGGNASQIAGTLKASGSLWIFNPAGVSFINGAQVDVGGVLSAAATGLSNHDAMFDAINSSYTAYVANPETATWDVPVAKFGTPEGNVRVDAGTVFNGNISLLGRQVSVSEGATFNGDLTLTAAGGQTDVDEISGGKVSISINDFADVDSDINVTFETATGEHAGSSLEVGGDLNVIADGSINVQGAVKADGDIVFKTVAKPGSEVVVGYKQMSVASGKLLQGKSVSATAAGRVQVDGNIEAVGDIDLNSGLYAAVDGSVISQNGNVNIKTVGNVNVAGNISAQDVTFSGTKATVAGNIVGNDLAVKSADGTANADFTQTAGVIDVASITAANIEQTGGTLTAPTITAANLKTAGAVVSTTKINANVEQTDGTLDAKDVEGATFKQSGGTATLTGTLTAAVDQDAGTLSANAVVGDVDQDGGMMTVDTFVTGNVNQKGTATDSFTAASVSGNVTQEEGNLATVTTASIGGDLEQNGGTVVAQGDTLTVTGMTTQNGGTIGDANDAITLTGKLTQNGGTVAADTLAANNGADIFGTVTAATSLTAAGKDVEVKSGGILAAPTITAANLKTAGKIKATTINGTIEQNNGLIEATTDNLTLNGDVHQNAGTIQASHLTLKNGDVIQAGDAAKIKTGELTFDNSKKIDLVSNNNEIDKLSGNLSELDIVDKDDLSLGQLSVGGSLKVKTGGSTKIDGKVTAGSSADIDAGQNVEFSSGGQLAASSAKVKAGANITQAGASVSVSRGYVNDAHLTAAIQAGSIDLTAGGNIGNGTYNYVTVGGGTVKASAGGDASIASAGSENLRVSSVSGANVSLYTAGKLITEGPVTSRGNTTVTAKEFGGIAQSSFGSSLTVNNLNNGARPLLAIFETKGGNKTPKINNQPNDTIVFIDGRLAGGDIQIINKLGALEAFPVQTPELKSEQGVFGNPNFLHDELDVANPFAVGAIDFLLQDVPLLTLTSDFPTEVDKQVAANGLNPTTSYWFGQNPQTEVPEKKDEAAEETKRKEGSSNDAVK